MAARPVILGLLFFSCIAAVVAELVPSQETSSLDSGARRSLLQSSNICNVTFREPDLDVAVLHCSSTGSPLCCENVELVILKGRANYANATRTLYLLQGPAEGCIASLQAGLDARKVAGGAAGVLARCNITAAAFTMPNLPSTDARACSSFDTIASFTTSNQAVRRACYSNYAANNTAGVPCSRTCRFPTSITEGLTYELNRGFGSGSTSFSSCVDSVLIVLAATAPTPEGRNAMGSCLWDPAETATCSAFDWNLISYDPIAAACGACTRGVRSGAGCSVDDDATKLCCNAILGAGSLVWAQYILGNNGTIFPPPIEGAACYDAYGAQLEQRGIGRFILTDVCANARDTFSTTHTGCQGMLTLGAVSAGTNQFSAMKPVCSPNSCTQGDCFGRLFVTSSQLAAQPGVSSTFIGCAETVLLGFLGVQPNRTSMEQAAACALGLNNASRVIFAPASGEATPGAATTSLPQSSGSSSGDNTAAIVGGVLGGLAGLVLISAVTLLVFMRQRQTRKAEEEVFKEEDPKVFKFSRASSTGSNGSRKVPIRDLLPKQSPSDTAVRFFTLEELRAATHDFSTKQLLGSGGSGQVYKGRLKDGRVVAVKKINAQAGALIQLENEANILSRLTHRNVVALLGWCDDRGEQALVFPYLPNGSLQYQLEREDAVMSWITRLRIALGTALGLEYLHSRSIIHRDVKSSNVLLDHEFTAKVADCGISREGPELGDTHITTGVKGTVGYLDPEYYFYHQLTEKSDCFSFGVVLLEMISGKRPIDLRRPTGQHNLLLWAKPLLAKGAAEELLDERLVGKVDPVSLKLVAEIAHTCLFDDSKLRPTMVQVKEKLEYSLHVALEALDLQRRREESAAEEERRKLNGNSALPSPVLSTHDATWTHASVGQHTAEMSLGSTFGEILLTSRDTELASTKEGF